jgi:hypothetical protein
VTAPAHSLAKPVDHDGPGHRYGDSSWCGGCWWEQQGRYETPSDIPAAMHALDCPACAAARGPRT